MNVTHAGDDFPEYLTEPENFSGFVHMAYYSCSFAVPNLEPSNRLG